MGSSMFNRFITGMMCFFAVTALTISGNNARAQYFSASQIYAYARANDANALYRLRNYLEMQDSYGNTALCMAVMDGNLQAYNLLKQYGANTQPSCLSAVMGGSSASVASASGYASSGTFLGMGTTGWIVTGAIVAGGVGIAAASGGGGGSKPEPACVHGKMVENVCVCDEGWTGGDCNTPKTCSPEYKESCSADEYTDGSICKSGDKDLKKCLPHTPMPNCQTYSPTSDTCAVCKEGWEGATCETPASCSSEYKETCSANEYSNGQTCKSGDSILKKCIEHTSMPNCQTLSTISDTCVVCKPGWTGATCADPKTCSSEYKENCANNEYTDGTTCQSGDNILKKCIVHTPMPNCITLSTTADICVVCEEGWEGSKCETAHACGDGYKSECGEDEYTDGNTCKSGDDNLKKCIAHTPMPNCQIFSTTSDLCLACKEGWEGDGCNTPISCGTGYKASCAADEYTDGSTCKSGDDVLKKCMAHTPMPNCQTLSTTSDTCAVCKEGWLGDTCADPATCGDEFKASCEADEYTDGSICKSGDSDLKKCIAHTPIPNCQTYSTTSDICAVCKEGWTGDICDTPAVCGDEFKASCAADEYTDGSTCKSGDNDLKKCIAHTPMPNCQTLSDTADVCAACKAGWEGDKCETAHVCGDDYKLECAVDEYTNGSTCQSGDNELKKCIAHTPMPNCETYSQISDSCELCKDGWTGATCVEPVDCGDEYKASCAIDEYTDGSTCKSGDDELKRCRAHTPMPHCETYSTDSDTCAVCKEGWDGPTCSLPADCGSDYKMACDFTQYTDGTTCKSGNNDLKKCIDHTPMPNCVFPNSDSDTCMICMYGWEGDKCETPHACGDDYKLACDANEYTDGNTCQSGNDVLKKCIAHTPLPNCQTYSGTEDVCETCKEGWAGDACDIVNTCGADYKVNCLASEYTNGSTCMSSGVELKQCIAHTPVPNCQTYSGTEDVCNVCKEGWTGSTCETPATCGDEFKTSCDADEYTDSSICKSGDNDLIKCIAHTPMPNCQAYNANSDTCMICKDGWTGDTCETPATCTDGFKESCAADEYTDGSICMSGDSPLKRCILHTPIINCETYSPTADICSVCKEGWNGDACNIADDCGESYKNTCSADEYTDGSTCKSGDDNLKKCITHTPMPNCQTYSGTEDVCNVCKEGWSGDTCETPATCGDEFKTSCDADEYTDSSICKSGDSDLIKCIAHTPMPNCQTYSATSDICAVCKNGWSGDICDTPATCGDEFKASCSADEYTDGSICKSGDDNLKKCIAHTPMPNCQTYNDNEDSCAVCKEGWNGDTCETPATCGDEFKASCAADEYTDGSICKSGDDNLKKCIAHTPMPNCQTYDDNEDSCAVCKEGWSGDTCDTPATCGDEFKASCEADEYTDGSTCKSGDDNLKKCIAHTPMPNCQTYKDNEDSCAVCKEGWDGDTCETPATCGDEFKASCATDEYTDGSICKSGDDNLKKCIAHTPMPNCQIYSDTEDVCVTCKAGYTGDLCDEISVINNDTDININDSQESAYGIKADEYLAAVNGSEGTITISGTLGEEAVGIDGPTVISDDSYTTNHGSITLSNSAHNAYGIKGYVGAITNSSTGSININGTHGDAYGMYGAVSSSGSNVELLNQGNITIGTTNGNAYGMFANAGETISNASEGTINISDTTGTAYGMYAENGASEENKTIVNNAGTITISNSPSAYGIYSSGANVVITNTGTIIINGDSCSGDACKDDDKFIKLNGATFNQSGILQSNVIKLDNYDGAVVATQSSKFIADDISGKLELNSDIVNGGFENTYTVDDMIKAENTSSLNLVSGSAMFDATLADNGDAVMSMKEFEDVVQDKSLAEFLKQNYAGENNESLYNELKKQKTITALNDALKDLTGSDVFSRFTFEDMTMMRELNMDMNNTLFNNEDKHLETSGSITPLNFDGNSGSNARYALYNNISGRKSVGFGFAFSDVRSNNGKDNKDTRQDQTFMVSTPFGYRTHGFKFITSPRFGYSYGTYSRDGYEGKNYDGKVEKRIFGLMNEVRYPISFGKWSVAPSAEFNMLGYNIRGHEDAQRYSLRIRSQNNYSVESGLGIYANREMKPTKNSLLKLNVGMAVYHEFADPYKLELGMSGMDGTYKVRDERRKDDRAVVRSGFDYSLGKDWSLIGSVATFLDGTTHNNANLDFKCNF